MEGSSFGLEGNTGSIGRSFGLDQVGMGRRYHISSSVISFRNWSRYQAVDPEGGRIFLSPYFMR